MYFQLRRLIVWPKNDSFAPQEIIFEPGKLNVITGLSRTGKSAIIPIIDYCLGSGECNIPIDTIRDAASWYGIIIQLQDEQMLICRAVPNGNIGSPEFYHQRGKTIVTPLTIQRNENQEGTKQMLNILSAVPYLGLETSEEKNGFKGRLSFRDLMALVFQTQDLVANQNIFFYKTHSHEHREKLRNWFPFILGAETSEILQARQQMELLEKSLRQLQREFEKVKNVSASWMNNMRNNMKIAREYGLHALDAVDTVQPETLLRLAKDILANIPDNPQTDSASVLVAAEEVRRLDKEETDLSEKIGKVKKRLTDVQRLESGLTEYGGAVRKRVERLHISKWLRDVAVEESLCAVCKSGEHPQSNAEVKKIADVLEGYEDELSRVSDIPPAFKREEEKLRGELATLMDERTELQRKIKALSDRDAEAQKLFQTRKDMFFFLGHLKASADTYESVSDGGDLAERIAKLESERRRLWALAEYQAVLQRTDIATAKIGQKILDHLKTLDVEDTYRRVPPKFSVKDLNLSVLSSDENWHPLAEVGSGSNWVSFHLALMCALQEYFLEQHYSSVPSFVVFDQPSQVYFPKERKVRKNSVTSQQSPNVPVEGVHEERISPPAEADSIGDGTESSATTTNAELTPIGEPDNTSMIPDEDKEAVKLMFTTISSSVAKSQGRWQAIILDHAGEDVYGSIDGVHKVVEWDKENKLIPLSWLQ